jgi:uncharacterized protein
LIPLIGCRRAKAIIAILGLAALGPDDAQASGIDCARATASIERKICTDPALSSADAALSRSFEAALALSLDPAGLRAEEVDWLTHSRDKAATNDELAQSYTRRQGELDKALGQLRLANAGRTIGAAEAATNCLPILAITQTAACTVTDYGELGAVDGHVFAYASYEYAKGEAQLDYRRVVIFEHIAPNALRAIVAPEVDPAFYYGKPQFLRSDGRTALHIPAYESGTGNFNRERLFVWRDGRWRDADVTGWLDDLARRLPVGEGVWQGVFPDYVALKASTPIWRKDDGNACPGGGRAELLLGWRGDRIFLKSVRLVKAGECGEPLRTKHGSR